MTPRPAPVLLLEFPLEETPRWQLVADTDADATRLRLWLKRSGAVSFGHAALEALSERLDELEEAA